MIQKEHFLGSISELKAATYFLDQGNQVYFPVVRQGQVDFIIENQKEILRVQVKTATWNKSGKNNYLQCRTRTTNKYQTEANQGFYDLLVIVYQDTLWNIPANLISSSNLSLTTGKWDSYKRVLRKENTE